MSCLVVLLLEDDISFNDRQSAVNLTTDTALYDRLMSSYPYMVRTAGWGITEVGASSASSDLLYVDVPIIDQTACNDAVNFPVSSLCFLGGVSRLANAGCDAMGDDWLSCNIMRATVLAPLPRAHRLTCGPHFWLC